VTWSVPGEGLIAADSVDSVLRTDGTATYTFHVVKESPLANGPNVSAETTRLTVRYPDPNRPTTTTPPVVVWHGTWQSSDYPIAGTFEMRYQIDGTVLSGEVSIAGSDCTSAGAVTGTTDGTMITFGTVAVEQAITWQGTISGNTMTGTYATPACGDDHGTWQATQ
jgi:hypothetical protein